MNELQHGAVFSTGLDSPDSKHHYYFEALPNQAVTITITAPSVEYEVTFVKKQHPIDKGGGVDAHAVASIDFTTTDTYTFFEATAHTVYLSIGSANQYSLPSAGYTIRMAHD